MKLNMRIVANFLKTLFIISLPILFIININLFFIALIIYFSLFLFDKTSIENKMFAILLNSFLYSGFIIKGLHIYDWILLVFFVVFIIRHQRLVIPEGTSFFTFFICILLCFVLSINSNSIVELSRYMLSFLAFILLFNFDIDNEYLIKVIYRVMIVNIYNAILVYLLYSKGLFNNYTTPFLASDVFLYVGEIRLNGFFSDPNKYFTFCLFLLMLIQLPIFIEKNNKFYNYVAIISCLISMSRTSLICLLLFVIFKVLKECRKYLSYRDYIVVIFITFVISFIGLIIVFKTNFIEQIYVFSAKILGRSQTIKVNTSLTGDNRTIIWKKAIGLIVDKPLLGSGLLAYKGLLSYPTHNTVLSLLLDGGVVLLLSFVNFFKKLYYKDLIYEIFPLIIVPMFFLDLGNYRILFIAYALILKQILINKHHEVWEKKNEYCNIN